MAITAAMIKELRELTGVAMMQCKKALQETNGDIKEAIKYLRERDPAMAAKRAGKTTAEGVIVLQVSDDAKHAFMAEVNSETDFVARDTNFRGFADKVCAAGLSEKISMSDELLAMEVDGRKVEVHRQELVAKVGENVQVRRVALLESNALVGAYKHGDRIGVLVALDQDNATLAKDIAMHIAATNPLGIDENSISPEVIAAEKAIFAKQAEETGKPAAIIEKMVEGRIKKFFKESTLLSQPFVKDPEQTVAALLKAANANVTAFVRFEVGEGIEKQQTDFAEEVKAQIQGSE